MTAPPPAASSLAQRGFRAPGGFAERGICFTSVEVLRALMDANNLRQKDLVPIFSSESIVSEVLHKKRALNKTHIEKLSKRFHVSPAVFF